MSDEQKVAWRYAMQHAPAGLLKKLDRSALTVWVCAEVSHASASREVTRLGLMVKGASGVPYQNPYLSIVNKQAVLMLKAAAELGFTPSSRSRVKVDPPPPGGGDPFADLKRLTD